MTDRDPNDISRHLQVTWVDVFGEPEGLYSKDGVWKCSFKCFEGTKNVCYMILSLLCAPIAAFWWGLSLACLGFQYIWCFNPCLRCCSIYTMCWHECYSLMLKAFCTPFVKAMALYFSKIRVHFTRAFSMATTSKSEKEALLKRERSFILEDV